MQGYGEEIAHREGAGRDGQGPPEGAAHGRGIVEGNGSREVRWLGWVVPEVRTVLLVVGAWYAAASVVSFVMYWWDKRAARRGRWRTREGRLHAVDLLGGWPGGLAAQRLLRHKTRDLRFRAWFWVTMVVHPLAWLGAGYLRWG